MTRASTYTAGRMLHLIRDARKPEGLSPIIEALKYGTTSAVGLHSETLQWIPWERSLTNET